MNENHFTENLVYYRKKKGMSQEKIAEYMEVSRQAVTKGESGLSRPSSEKLMKLAELFEISIEELLDGEGNKKELQKKEISMGKEPWIFIGISGLCMLIYGISRSLTDSFSSGI